MDAGAERGRRRAGPGRRLALAAGALALAFLGLELGLRCALFASDAPVLWRLRRPRDYADARYEELHWRLRRRVGGVPAVRPQLHPRLGWVSALLNVRTLDHVDRRHLGGRRPVLLYGDSYARCTTPAGECFGALLEAAPLGRELALLNHGVRGYGLDQTWLLLDATLDRHVDERPLVLVGVFVDDDLDRCLFELREWPKPRLAVADGRIVGPTGALPTPEEAFAGELGVASYAWRRLLHSPVFPSGLRERWIGVGARRRELEGLVPRIVDAVVDRLEAAGVPFAFVLFHGEEALERLTAAEPDWRHELLSESLARRGAPYVSTRELLLADAEESGRTTADYFGREGAARGHYDALGNRVAFGGIERALEGLVAGDD